MCLLIDSSGDKEDDRGRADRPNTPPSREGSVTPTPEDLDQEEPSTPKEAKSRKHCINGLL